MAVQKVATTTPISELVAMVAVSSVAMAMAIHPAMVDNVVRRSMAARESPPTRLLPVDSAGEVLAELIVPTASMVQVVVAGTAVPVLTLPTTAQAIVTRAAAVPVSYGRLKLPRMFRITMMWMNVII